MSDDDISPFGEERLAFDRIARTRDGMLIHRYLRRVLETVFDTPEDGALRSHNGRRTLARDLMRLMADGIEGTSGRTDDSPILTRPGSPAGRSGSPRGIRRRVEPDPAVGKFLDEHGADEA